MTMGATVQGVLDAFQNLTPDEQRQVASEILIQTRSLDLPPLDEETIDRIANDSFLEYDLREASDAKD